MLSPVKLLKPGARWWEVGREVVGRLDQHNSALLAGGIALYGLLSVFPGLAGAVLIYGLFATRSGITRHMRVFAEILPPGVWNIFNAQLHNVAAHDHGALTAAAVIGVLLSLWNARLTVGGLMTATNIACGTRERRGYFLRILISVALTLATVMGVWLVLSGLFSVYMSFFGSYDRTYGALTGVIVLLMWFYLLSFTVVAGAELNSVMDARSAHTAQKRGGRCFLPD